MSTPRQTGTSSPGRKALQRALSMEPAGARAARTAGDTGTEWHHLERSQVLSQPMAAAHVRIHLAMLLYGIRAHDRHEVIGQMIRLAVAGPGSLSGRSLVGNTGGAAISALAVLSIPDDLRDPLEGAS